MADRQLYIELVIDDKGAATTLRTVDKAITGVGTSAKSSTTDLDKLERSVTKAAAAGTALGQAVYATARGALTSLASQMSLSVSTAAQFQNAFAGLGSIAKSFGADVDAAKGAAQSLASDGLMTVAEAAQGLKNLLATGFALPEAIQLMNGFKDSAAFGRQASLDFGYAIVSATEGVKNGNSILVDNAGLTKNLSVILKEAGKSATDLGLASSDASVRQALLKGMLKEMAPMAGDAAKMTQSYSGQVAALNTNVTLLRAEMGERLMPIFTLANTALNVVVGTAREYPKVFTLAATAVGALILAATGFAAWAMFGTTIKAVAGNIVTLGTAAKTTAVSISTAAAAVPALTMALATIVVPVALYAIAAIVKEIQGLMNDSANWRADAVAQNATHLRALGEASRVAGREITNVAEAQGILRLEALRLQDINVKGLDLHAQGAIALNAHSDAAYAAATGTRATTTAVQSYGTQLRDLDKKVQALTAAQRAEIDAGKAVGANVEAISKQTGIAADVLARYLGQVTTNTRAEKAAAKAFEEAMQQREEAGHQYLADQQWLLDQHQELRDREERAALEYLDRERITYEYSVQLAQEAADKKAAILKADSDYRDEMAQDYLERELELHQASVAYGRRTRDEAKAVVDDIAYETAASFADMLVGAASFKDGMIGIWRSIQGGIANILTSILQDFTKRFITGLIAAARGGSFSQSMAGMFSMSSLGLGGSAAGGTGTAAGAGISMGALAGPAAGAGVGYYTGWRTGSPVKGALAGAGTGAAVGTIFAPGVGTAVGAGVGAIAGWAGGVMRKRSGAKVNDERDDWMMGQAGIANLREAQDAMRGLMHQAGLTDAEIKAVFAVDRPKDWAAASEYATAKIAEQEKILEHYNITWQDFQGEERTKRLGAAVKAVTKDFDALTRAGLTHEAAARKVEDAYVGLATEAVRAGEEIPAALAPVLLQLARMGELTEAQVQALLGLDAGTQALRELEDVASRHGFTVEDLGEKYRNLKIAESASALMRDWDILMKNGIDATQAAKLLKDEFGELITSALRFGVELPASMRPVLQSMIDNQQLVDENGQSLVDLSRINFAEPIAASVDRLIGKLETLIETIQGAGSALADLPDHTPAYDLTEAQTYHTGGMIRRAHTGLAIDEVPIIAQTGEGVLSRRGMQAIGGSAGLFAANHGGGPLQTPAVDPAVAKQLARIADRLEQQGDLRMDRLEVLLTGALGQGGRR